VPTIDGDVEFADEDLIIASDRRFVAVGDAREDQSNARRVARAVIALGDG
jgi:hypothetical protein